MPGRSGQIFALSRGLRYSLFCMFSYCPCLQWASSLEESIRPLVASQGKPGEFFQNPHPPNITPQVSASHCKIHRVPEIPRWGSMSSTSTAFWRASSYHSHAKVVPETREKKTVLAQSQVTGAISTPPFYVTPTCSQEKKSAEIKIPPVTLAIKYG